MDFDSSTDSNSSFSRDVPPTTILVCCKCKVTLPSIELSPLSVKTRCNNCKKTIKFSIKNYLRKMKKEDKSDHRCTFQSIHSTIPAVHFCVNCNKWICIDCCNIHKENLQLTKHLIISKEVMNNNSDSFKYYCRTCEIPIKSKKCLNKKHKEPEEPEKNKANEEHKENEPNEKNEANEEHKENEPNEKHKTNQEHKENEPNEKLKEAEENEESEELEESEDSEEPEEHEVIKFATLKADIEALLTEDKLKLINQCGNKILKEIIQLIISNYYIFNNLNLYESLNNVLQNIDQCERAANSKIPNETTNETTNQISNQPTQQTTDQITNVTEQNVNETKETIISDDLKENSRKGPKLKPMNFKEDYVVHTYSNGDVYEGNWVNNKRHGKGKMTYAHGPTYDGDWVNDKYEGRGTYVFSNGMDYKGYWKNNKRNGRIKWWE